MRLAPIAAALGLLCVGVQAEAASYSPPPDQMFMQCQQFNANLVLAKGASTCAAAAAGYASIAARTRNWSPYLRQALALQLEARDQAGLGHHRLAFETALMAHRLALYVYRYFPGLDPDDYAQIADMARELVAFEATEKAKVQRNADS